MNSGPPRWLGLLFLLFIGGGLAGTWAMVGRPLLNVQAAREWRPTPCMIQPAIEPEPAGGASSTGLSFVYAVDGRPYRSSRWSFFDHLSSGHGRVPETFDSTCYVNPANPADAVLDRGIPPVTARGLIPLGIAFIGAIGYFATRRRRRGVEESGPAVSRYRTPVVPVGKLSTDGMVELRPSGSPIGKLIAVSIFALFWNGIISVFLFNIAGSGFVCGMVFLIPFVLIGLGAIGMAGYFALALFNPRPILRVSGMTVMLGDSIQLRWAFTGRFDRISRLRIGLVGREEATYRRGTRTTTDRKVFYRRYAVDTAQPVDIQRGATSIPIPADTMHTFLAPANKIVWHVVLHGEIERWPDVKEEYPIEVTPMRPALPLPLDEDRATHPAQQEEAA